MQWIRSEPLFVLEVEITAKAVESNSKQAEYNNLTSRPMQGIAVLYGLLWSQVISSEGAWSLWGRPHNSE